jgi:hypothetical protein
MSEWTRPVTSSCGVTVKARLLWPLVGGQLPIGGPWRPALQNSRDYAARSAVVTGSRAARTAGNSPPTKPINNAMTTP